MGILNLILLSSLVVTLVGCSDSAGSKVGKAKALADDLVKVNDELVIAMEGVRDAQTAKAAAAQINSIADRLQALEDQKAKLALSQQEIAEVAQYYQLKANEKDIVKRMGRASGTSSTNAAGEANYRAAMQRVMDIQRNAVKKSGW